MILAGENRHRGSRLGPKTENKARLGQRHVKIFIQPWIQALGSFFQAKAGLPLASHSIILDKSKQQA